MIDPNRYAFASEFYIVEKAVELEVRIADHPWRIRIEALYGPGRRPPFSTRAYIEQPIPAGTDYPHPKGSEPAKADPSVWVSYNLPWTAKDTADAAIEQALGFLSTECDPP